MQRLTISIEDDLATDFEALIEARGHGNRSEAVRDLVRRELGHAIVEAQPETPCVQVRRFAHGVLAQRGVRQCGLHLVPLQGV